MAAGWSQQLINYCERAGHGFWDEPVNALTNGAFIVAALAVIVMQLRGKARDRPVALLALVVLMVGAGSFLFHTFATRGAMLADVLPIAIFIYGYLLLALTRFAGLRLIAALAVLAAFFVINVMAQIWGGRALNGSVAYLPALLAMPAVALLLYWQAARSGGESNLSTARGLLLAAGLFALSLLFRSIDREVCNAIPLGTHFLWHLLNAALLYWLLRLAALHRRTAAIM